LLLFLKKKKTSFVSVWQSGGRSVCFWEHASNRISIDFGLPIAFRAVEQRFLLLFMEKKNTIPSFGLWRKEISTVKQNYLFAYISGKGISWSG
jgi:isocitrate/isopropylmalate dehydrogenase